MIIYLRPSAAAVWSVCAGYVRMLAAFPDDGLDEDDRADIREEGKAWHSVAHARSQKVQIDVGMIAPNGVAVTAEMIDTADEYLQHIAAWGVPAVFEQTRSISSIYPGMEGTPDVWAHDKARKVLYVGDGKYGYRYVEVIRNKQMTCYASSLMENFTPEEWRDTTVVFAIYQPRSYGHDAWRTWSCKAWELRDAINNLFTSAARAMSPDAVCTPNPGCHNCRGSHACDALQSAALRTVEVSQCSTADELPIMAADDELRRLQYGAKLLEARIIGLEAQVEAAARKGAALRWHALQVGKAGRLVWKDGSQRQIIALGKLLGKKVTNEPTLRTPTQLTGDIGEDVVSMYSHRPKQAVKLVPVDTYAAERVFTKDIAS